MVADLAAVENRGRAGRLSANTTGDPELPGHSLDQIRQHFPHIVCQITAVCARIGHQLLLIQALGVVQSLLSREAKDAVCVSLQACQVVE